MKGWVALLVLIMAIGSAFSLQVSPETIDTNMTVGQRMQVSVDITNQLNETLLVTFHKSGSAADFILFSEPLVVIGPESVRSTDIYIDVPLEVSEGTYDGNIDVISNVSSEEAVINLSIKVAKWIFKKQFWIDEGGTIKIDPYGVHIIVSAVGPEVNTSIGIFSPGDVVFLADNQIRVKLIDRYEGKAKFEISTTDPYTSVQIINPKAEEEPACKIEPIVSIMAFKIQKDSSTTKYISFRNNCDKKLVVKTIYFTGDIIDTPEGTKPLSYQAEVGTVDPGAEFSIRIDVDTHGVETGKYAATLYVVGYADTIRLEAKTDFVIDVISGIRPSSYVLSPNITYPKQVEVGKAFDIIIANVPKDASIVVLETSGISKIKEQRTDTYYKWTGKITEAGTKSVYISISYGNQIYPAILQITAEQPVPKIIKVVLQPEKVYPGTFVELYAVDQNSGEKLDDAEILVKVYDKRTGEMISQFVYSSQFKAECNKRYYVEATKEGYTSDKVWIEVNDIPTKLSIDPEEPKLNETVTVKYLSLSDSAPVPGATITINGETFGDSIVTFKADSEQLDIEAKAECYQLQSTVVPVEVPLKLIKSGGKRQPGKTVWWLFNKEVEWSIKKDGEELSSGLDQNVTLTFVEPGKYQLYADGKLIEEFKISPSYLSNPKYILIALLVGFAVILISKIRGSEYLPPEEISGVPKFSLGGSGEFTPPASTEVR